MKDYLIQRLLHLASRPITYPVCPIDGAELDLHFHGGASCPRCGHDFAIGYGNEVLPSDHFDLRSIEERAAEWPDTIPFTSALRKAPVRPQEGSGAVSPDSWGTRSSALEDLEEEEDWKPTIPSLDEVAAPSPERYFKWLHHPTHGTHVWEVDGPDGDPWHAHKLREIGVPDRHPDHWDFDRGYAVLNHNGGVVHNYGWGFNPDVLSLVAPKFQEHYPETQWQPYT